MQQKSSNSSLTLPKRSVSSSKIPLRIMNHKSNKNHGNIEVSRYFRHNGFLRSKMPHYLGSAVMAISSDRKSFTTVERIKQNQNTQQSSLPAQDARFDLLRVLRKVSKHLGLSDSVSGLVRSVIGLH